MGTTLAAIYVVKGKILCTNIGDTRIYHYSKGVLEQISFDHTHAQTIVDAGGAAQNDIGRIPDAKRLTKHLGVFPEEATLSPNISVIDDVDNGDIILLCSDGLTDMLSDEDITAILSTGESSQDVASKLIRTALERGGKDNVTVMAALLDVEETAIFAPIAAAMRIMRKNTVTASVQIRFPMKKILYLLMQMQMQEPIQSLLIRLKL